MSLPATAALIQEHLFNDVDKMNAVGVPAIHQQRIIRIRDIYNRWLQTPQLRDREIVDMLRAVHNISQSQAYEDLRMVKGLIGDLNKAAKSYHRWRFNQMAEETYNMAKNRKDMRTMAAIAKSYAHYNAVNVEDEQDNPWEVIVVQPFEPTNDPSVIGIKPVPNIHEKIAAKLAQYGEVCNEIQDVTYEVADFREEDLFKPSVTEIEP